MPLPLLAIVSFLAAPQADAAAASPEARPNVILILADDLGIGDLSATHKGAKIKTPHLSRLAAEGMTFTDAHSPSSVCTPTRYGLMTGRYSWRSRLARGVLGGRSDHLIPADRPTVAHLMSGAGYSTAMIGKWHLGWDWAKVDGKIDFTKPVQNGPDTNGFDEYFAHSGSLDMPPYVWVNTGRVTAQPDREEGVERKDDRYGWYRKGPIGSDFHIEEVLPKLFGRATAHIEARAEAERPFFLYLALPAPHTPIVPIEPFLGASGLNPYADFVQQMDHHVGELLAALDEAGLTDDTLVLFTSDNGCSPEANFELLKKAGHDPSAGYRGHKADLYEGGHRVPLIARWPGQIPEGQTTNALASLTDMYATLAELTEQSAPDIEDSVSLMPVLTGEAEGARASLISHSVSGHFAVRQGPWKLMLAYGSGGWSAPNEKAAKKAKAPSMQLYHLGRDPGETQNVAAEEPETVARLLALLEDDVQRGRSTPGPAVKNDREVKLTDDK